MGDSGIRPLTTYFPQCKPGPRVEVEVHKQCRRRMLGVYEENVRCLIILLWAVRRYTGITLGFRSQGVEQFV